MRKIVETVKKMYENVVRGVEMEKSKYEKTVRTVVKM